MHQIPPQVEALLRAQGVGDDELEELRRTGRLERRSADGSSSISIQASDLDDVEAGTMQLDPAVLDKLQRFNRFIPAAARANLEVLTGVDLDGDGRIGDGSAQAAAHRSDAARTADEPSGTTAPAHEHVTRATHGHVPSGAMPGSSNVDGPFVQQRRSGSVAWILLALVAVGAVAYLVMR